MTTDADVTTRDNPRPLVELKDVVKHFPVRGGVLRRSHTYVHAVSGVSLSIPAGSTYGLVGESGCGKSTLGRLLVGLEQLTDGAIIFDGRDITKIPRSARRDLHRDIQLMFQDPYASLNPRMRVDGIVREPLNAQRMGTRRDQDAKVRALLKEVGLPPDAASRHPHEFSGGQRQRIGLARAIALNPRLIVADEPVSALDVSIRAQVLNLMQDMQKRHHTTYLVISHDLTVVRYVADHLGVMYLGKLVETGPSDEVYRYPAHPYTKALIDTIPIPDPRHERAKDKAGIRGELPSATDPPSGCRFRTRCPFAQQVCAEEEPPLRRFGPGHYAACHFPLRAPSASTGEPRGMTATSTGQP